MVLVMCVYLGTVMSLAAAGVGPVGNRIPKERGHKVWSQGWIEPLQGCWHCQNMTTWSD